MQAPDRIWIDLAASVDCYVADALYRMENDEEYVRADLFEALTAERDSAIEAFIKVTNTCQRLRVERDALRAALQRMVYETTHLSPMEDDGSHWCKISEEALAQARAALLR